RVRRPGPPGPAPHSRVDAPEGTPHHRTQRRLRHHARGRVEARQGAGTGTPRIAGNRRPRSSDSRTGRRTARPARVDRSSDRVLAARARPAQDRSRVVMTTPRVEVAITIRAPRERVFDAWLDPNHLARFLCAGATRVARIEVDAREGGQFRIVMASDRGEYDHRGRYVEITRPERLRFTCTSAATTRVPTA